jgi:chemotaxis signal transduction protein
MMKKFLLVEAGAKQMLLALENVREILPFLPLDPLSVAGTGCIGVANIRSELIPVFLVDQACTPALESMIVVCEQAEHLVGLLVDNVIDLIDVADSNIASNHTGNGRTLHYAKVDNSPITILELSDVVHART